jgi:hypothetical protein
LQWFALAESKDYTVAEVSHLVRRCICLLSTLRKFQEYKDLFLFDKFVFVIVVLYINGNNVCGW